MPVQSYSHRFSSLGKCVFHELQRQCVYSNCKHTHSDKLFGQVCVEAMGIVNEGLFH